VTGNCLGRGGFSEVYEVIAIELEPNISAQCTKEQQKLRQGMVETGVVDLETGRGRFVIKHLQDRFLDEATQSFHKAHEGFCFAATDVVLEGAYLQTMDHPHILPLRGLPIDGIKAWNDRDPRHDGYFLLLDRLDDTLHQRIRKWEREARENSNDCDSSDRHTLLTKIKYALELADAVRYLHDNRIVFRDCKPHVSSTKRGVL
jgi:serine/threonine protein kinase